MTTLTLICSGFGLGMLGALFAAGVYAELHRLPNQP